eukprot:410527_1
MNNNPSCESEINTVNNCARALTNIICEDSLSITKDDNVTSIIAGDGSVFTFEMIVTNNGPSTSRSVNVRDVWPAAYTLSGNARTNSSDHICLTFLT